MLGIAGKGIGKAMAGNAMGGGFAMLRICEGIGAMADGRGRLPVRRGLMTAWGADPLSSQSCALRHTADLTLLCSLDSSGRALLGVTRRSAEARSSLTPLALAPSQGRTNCRDNAVDRHRRVSRIILIAGGVEPTFVE